MCSGLEILSIYTKDDLKRIGIELDLRKKIGLTDGILGIHKNEDGSIEQCLFNNKYNGEFEFISYLYPKTS